MADSSVRELIWTNAKEAARGIYRDNVFEFTNAFFPRSFVRADIAVKKRPHQKVVFVQALYKPGFEFLKSIMKGDGDMGDYNRGLKASYERLEAFVRDRDMHLSCLEEVFNRKNASETAMTLVMAVHLFGKLVPGALTVDKQMKGLKEFKNKCPCGCGEGFHAGDTGIGVPSAWHGFADTLVHDVPVISVRSSGDIDNEEEEDSEHRDSVEQREEPPEKKCRSDNLKSEHVISQMVATTITNSFAQVAAKPELGSKFVPAFCCSKQGIIIYAYNVEHDLFVNNTTDEAFFDKFPNLEFNLVMIIEIWLALNMYWTGSDAGSVKSCLMKSEFQDLNDTTRYKAAMLKASHFDEFDDEAVKQFFTVKRFCVPAFDERCLEI